MNRISRRGFIAGCSGALAGMAGTGLANTSLSVGSALAAEDLLVVVFLRGGWDALGAIVPRAGADRGYYEAARPTIQVPVPSLLALDNRFGFHPAFAPLHPLYKQGKLAVIHAAGLPTNSRSHFDAQLFIELGTPGSKSATTGWLTRHLATAAKPSNFTLLPVLSTGDSQPTALRGSHETATIRSLASFRLSGAYHDAQKVALRSMYDGDHWMYQAGTTALDATDVIAYLDPGTYTPSPGAVYPEGDFGDQLKTAAQLAKLNAGMRIVTVDFGGWDSHIYYGDTKTGRFAKRLGELAQGLAAFYKDLDGAANQNLTSRLTVVVQTEFGRRLRENANYGTDHGHGGAMLVMGGHVNGGKVYGAWPGLNTSQLYDRADLAVTTDYRQVLAEIVVKRLGNANLTTIFPGMGTYQPLGVVQ